MTPGTANSTAVLWRSDSHVDLRLTKACKLAAVLAWAIGVWLAPAAQAASLSYCDSHGEIDTPTQDRLIQVAAIVKTELERSGQRVALVARPGLAL